MNLAPGLIKRQGTWRKATERRGQGPKNPAGAGRVRQNVCRGNGKESCKGSASQLRKAKGGGKKNNTKAAKNGVL